MPFYLGTLASGKIITRSSTRSDFTHAAYIGRKIPNFGTSPEGAAKNAEAYMRPGDPIEIVPVRIVTAAEYHAAKKAAR